MKLIAGPCAIEKTGNWLIDIAGAMTDITSKLGIGSRDFFFKSSFDKANRTSLDSFRSIGVEKALIELDRVNTHCGCSTLTDVHETEQVGLANCYVQAFQIPAFLCRQTSLIEACVKTGKPVNIKKGQWLSPTDAIHVYDKAWSLCIDEPSEQSWRPTSNIWICERGTSFGYNHLVVDIPGLVQIAQKAPVIFDCTHSLQSSGGVVTSGRRHMIPHLARAVAATGFVDGYFMEVHPDPDHAKSDAATQIPLSQFETFLEELLEYHEFGKSHGTMRL